VAWLTAHEHRDRKYGHVYRYHPRSGAHSVALCTFILEDLAERCRVLREHAKQGRIAYGINVVHVWPNGKRKTIDLAVGTPAHLAPAGGTVAGIARATAFTQVLISCEAKTVMTEHNKSQPRIFDELSSSREIVHQGRQDALAAGITVVNISESFVSPLRQKSRRKIVVTRHRQPHVAEAMLMHLRGLPIREQVGKVGFDAYCSFVVSCDNLTGARLWTDTPAPQPGDPDHYDSFVARIASCYAERFGVVP
jgi:hypothetical protein